MAYTRYPEEAENFNGKATEITNKLNTIKSSLSDIAGILDNGRNDFLSLKALETNGSIEGVVNSAIGALESDSGLVNRIAQELEDEERLRQLRLIKQKHEEV